MNAHSMQFRRSLAAMQTHATLSRPEIPARYTWGKWNWDLLFQDIDENDPGYFMDR